jgi:hypothetical protein
MTRRLLSPDAASGLKQDQLFVLDGLTGFSSMSLPCFDEGFALDANIESSHGSCASSLT